MSCRQLHLSCNLRAFTAKPQGQEDLSHSPVLQPQLHPKLHPLWCDPAESSDRWSRWGYCRPHLLQDYVKNPKYITMNAETFHYWCRLLLGKADIQVQSHGCALLPSAPLRRAPIMAPRLEDSRQICVVSGSPSVCSELNTMMVMLVKSCCCAVSVTVSWKT